MVTTTPEVNTLNREFELLVVIVKVLIENVLRKFKFQKGINSVVICHKLVLKFILISTNSK